MKLQIGGARLTPSIGAGDGDGQTVALTVDKGPIAAGQEVAFGDRGFIPGGAGEGVNLPSDVTHGTRDHEMLWGIAVDLQAKVVTSFS